MSLEKKGVAAALFVAAVNFAGSSFQPVLRAVDPLWGTVPEGVADTPIPAGDGRRRVADATKVRLDPRSALAQTQGEKPC